MTATATLNGLPILNSGPVRWPIKDGTKPTYQTFDMTPADAQLLLSLGPKPVTLVIAPDSGPGLTVSFLYAIHAAPSSVPDIARVTVVDRRIWWSYKFIYRVFNWRRNVGTKRIEAVDQPAINPLAPNVLYAAWSTRDGEGQAPWRANNTIDNVVNAVLAKETEVSGVTAPLVFEANFSDKIRDLPIEDLLIRDTGDAAIDRVLDYMPQAAIYVDPDGTVVVRSKATGGEATAYGLAGPETVDGGHVVLVSNAALRPKEIHVLFQYLAEVRFDFLEDASATSTRVKGDEERYMENVLPIPDYELSVGGIVQAQGTYITVDQALNAWGNFPGFGRSLNHADLQKAFIPFVDLWAALNTLSIRDASADWAGRLTALQTHYRQTFRISARWMDKIFQLRDRRVAIVDSTSGTTAPALVYSDYAIISSPRSLFKNAVNSEDLAYTKNKKCYPNNTTGPNGTGEIAVDNPIAQATVSIEDADQGIIRLNYQADKTRMYTIFLPSMVTNDDNVVNADGTPGVGGPTSDPSDLSRPISFDAISDISKQPKLTNRHKCAIIISAIPASPNNEGQFYKVVVYPKDIKGLIPTSALAGLGAASGPSMEVAIGANLDVARIVWSDKRFGDTEKIFGVGSGAPQLQGMVLNGSGDERPDGGANLGSQPATLDNIAKARAASIYASLVDRIVGESVHDFRPALRPVGWLSEIEHTLSADGKLQTKLMMPERIQPFTLEAFLNTSTRFMILKLASPGRAAA